MPNPNDHLQVIDAVSGDLLGEYRREAPEDAAEVVGGRSSPSTGTWPSTET